MSYRIAINSMVTGKLPQGSPLWGEFNDSFVNQELDVIEIANAIYTGHAYTTWQKGRRSTDNFVCGQHIAIDLDRGQATIDALINHDLIKLYGGIIHTTPSHTTEAPRARVLFLLDEPITNRDGYAAATNFLMSQFADADNACKDPSRFFYGAQGCELWFDEKYIPLAHLRTYYKRWNKARPKPTHKAIERPQNIETDMEKVQAALATIDPWAIDYTQWVAVLAALHDGLGDGALSMAEQWAQGKGNEVEKKWRTFGKYGGERAGLGTIFHLARGH